MNIPILYEDEDIIVINKPAGITVNRADTTKHEVTVQDWAESKIGLEPYKNSEAKEESEKDEYSPIVEFRKRGGVVHRLDKETSGILLLAKNPQAFVALQTQFKERTVKKVYRALAHGEIMPKEGEINVPVGRLPWNRKQFGIVPGGRESKTLYKVIQLYRNIKTKETLTDIELYPQSGRTHQIRVHLKYIGHPIFSDFLYAGRKTSREDRKVLPRVFLHAYKISFIHPTNGNEMHFEAPLPEELQNVFQSMTPQKDFEAEKPV